MYVILFDQFPCNFQNMKSNQFFLSFELLRDL